MRPRQSVRSVLRQEPGIAYRVFVPLTAALMGLLLGGGLMWWAERLAEVIA